MTYITEPIEAQESYQTVLRVLGAFINGTIKPTYFNLEIKREDLEHKTRYDLKLSGEAFPMELEEK
jgi:hypothetical protein